MNRTANVAIAFLMLASIATFNSAQAADKAKSEKISVMGKVSTVKKDVDEFTSIKLTSTADQKVYNITLDEKGIDLGKKYDGISVMANGTVITKDKELWLTVTSTGEKKGKKK